MEHWASDQFYSNFPSLNAQNENQRANLRRAQQLEYQNYIESTRNAAIPAAHKTDTQLILNNSGNNELDKESDNRPISTRHKLLEDLKHIELSNMMYGDAVLNRNKENIMNESRKKKAYQQELIRQIEEKRNQVKMMKEKEKRDDEVLTRKLEEELKTIDLQRQLEEEQIRIEKAYLGIEQNKLIRDELLNKLENDRKLQSESQSQINGHLNSENYIETPTTISSPPQNQVYKFFRNSARREYQRVHNNTNNNNEILTENGFDEFATEIQKFDLDKGGNQNTQICSNHPHQNACTFCNIKLNRFENRCRHCSQQFVKAGPESRQKLCENCESLYFICLSCNSKTQICNFCQENRNICMQCIKNFCVHCGNSVRSSAQNLDGIKQIRSGGTNCKKYQTIGHSFQILQVKNENGEIANHHHHEHFSIHSDTTTPLYPEIDLIDDINIENSEILQKTTNEKLAKYYKNYGDLAKSKKPIELPVKKPPILGIKNSFTKYDTNLNKIQRTSDSDHSTNFHISGDKEHNGAVVLTQLGAVRRQLQMDKLKLDNNIH